MSPRAAVVAWLEREAVLAERRLAAALKATAPGNPNRPEAKACVRAYGRRDEGHEDIAVIRRLLRPARRERGAK